MAEGSQAQYGVRHVKDVAITVRDGGLNERREPPTTGSGATMGPCTERSGSWRRRPRHLRPPGSRHGPRGPASWPS